MTRTHACFPRANDGQRNIFATSGPETGRFLTNWTQFLKAVRVRKTQTVVWLLCKRGYSVANLPQFAQPKELPSGQKSNPGEPEISGEVSAGARTVLGNSYPPPRLVQTAGSACSTDCHAPARQVNPQRALALRLSAPFATSVEGLRLR
jgi:hypothetical protein